MPLKVRTLRMAPTTLVRRLAWCSSMRRSRGTETMEMTGRTAKQR